MAGSFDHINDQKTGDFRFDLIENMGDAYEACEDCHRIITDIRARLAAAEAERDMLKGALRSVVISANRHAIERGKGPADMAPLDKPLRDRIEAALEAAPEVPAKPEVCRWKGVKSLDVHRVGCRTGMLRDWHGFTYCPDCGRKIEVDNG